MYKFTNGLVVFDEKTKNACLEAGYKLVEKQMTIDDVNKVKDEEDTSNATVGKEHTGNNKKNTKNRN